MAPLAHRELVPISQTFGLPEAGPLAGAPKVDLFLKSGAVGLDWAGSQLGQANWPWSQLGLGPNWALVPCGLGHTRPGSKLGLVPNGPGPIWSHVANGSGSQMVLGPKWHQVPNGRGLQMLSDSGFQMVLVPQFPYVQSKMVPGPCSVFPGPWPLVPGPRP